MASGSGTAGCCPTRRSTTCSNSLAVRGALVFQIDLFAATGPLPVDLAQVIEREKDIRYSSRTRLNTDRARQRQALAQAARRLFARLPESFADDPDLMALKAATVERAVTVVHLIYRRVSHETHSKDYEFSRLSMLDHWQSGIDDVQDTLAERALEEPDHSRGRLQRLRPDAPASVTRPRTGRPPCAP